MKKILSLLAISTLSINSTSSLKPLLTNINIAFNSQITNDKNSNLFINKITNIPDNKIIIWSDIAPNATAISIETSNQCDLWKSTDDNIIIKIITGEDNTQIIIWYTIAWNGTVYVETYIKDHINKIKINTYLKLFSCNNEKYSNNAKTDVNHDDSKLIKPDKPQTDVITSINSNLPDINQEFETTITTAENNINLHGYTINQLLNGKTTPKTKDEIDNFANGKSYYTWLQDQANLKFHSYQLTMGLSIGLPLGTIAILIAGVIHWKLNSKYNPFARARKDDRAEKRALKKVNKNTNIICY